MNISKLLLYSAIVCFFFPTITLLGDSQVESSREMLVMFFSWLGMQFKATLIAFLLFYTHKMFKKKNSIWE